MRLILSFIAMGMFGLLVLTACNSAEQTSSKSSSLAAASPATKAPADGIRRITVVELKDLVAKDAAVIVDVRTEDAYRKSHIKGARLIAETEVAKRSNELPKDKLIVTYCA